MEKFQKKTIKKILKNKKKLEKKLKVRINIKGKKVNLEGDELDIYTAEKVLEAIDRSFPIKAALLLLDENYMLAKIPIKKYSKRKKIDRVRARIIGKGGKTLKTIKKLSNCEITLHDNVISILGPTQRMRGTTTAIIKLIKGSKQANVYAFLEKEKAKPKITDLGLKE